MTFPTLSLTSFLKTVPKHRKLDFLTYWAFTLVESMTAAIVTITVIVTQQEHNYHINKLLQLQDIFKTTKEQTLL